MKYQQTMSKGVESRSNPSGPYAIHSSLPNAPKASERKRKKRKDQRVARKNNR
jgi:hypothetical protein